MIKKRSAVQQYKTQETKYQERAEAIDLIRDIRTCIKGKLNYKRMIDDGRKY